MSSWNDTGMGLEAGDYCLWYGRLVEFVELLPSSLARVKFVDEGDIVWTYDRVGWSELQKLGGGRDETVLDAVQQAAAPRLTIDEQLYRMAELWFAAPAAGDMFEVPGSVQVKVHQTTAADLIHATVQVYSDRFRTWGSSPVSWPSSAAFRAAYRCAGGPGYTLRAGATNRPDFRAHPLLSPPGQVAR